MLRGFLCAIVIVALSAALNARSWPPSRVASFPAPPGARDVAFEGSGPLYVLAPGTPSRVYKLTNLGSIVESFTVAVPGGARGITYEAYGNWMWVSNRINRHIYRLTATGSLAGSFACPVGTPYGLGYSDYNPQHGRGLFVSCRDENLIVRLNQTTGSLLSSFAGPASAVIGYDDWLCVDRDSNYLYWDYYREWRVLDTLPARPYGVGTGARWPTDQLVRGFVLCRNGYIYYYMGYSAVAPASLGRVRALFR